MDNINLDNLNIETTTSSKIDTNNFVDINELTIQETKANTIFIKPDFIIIDK